MLGTQPVMTINLPTNFPQLRALSTSHNGMRPIPNSHLLRITDVRCIRWSQTRNSPSNRVMQASRIEHSNCFGATDGCDECETDNDVAECSGSTA